MPINSYELFVGIDVSEAKFDVTYRNSKGQIVRPDRKFPNTPDGIRDLKGSIVATASLVGENAEIHVGMEATSNFHKALERELRRTRPKKLHVHIINPYVIKQFRKMNLMVQKTDRTPSEMIALYMIKRGPPVSVDLPEGQEELKEVTRLRRSLVEETTQYKNRLRRLLTAHFPGYKLCFGQEISKRMLVVFSRFGSPDQILNEGEDNLGKMAISFRHKLGKNIASKLIHLAQTAPQVVLPKAICMSIIWTAARILQLQEQIKQLDEQIELLLVKFFPNHQLTSVPGLGPVSIACIIAEVGNIDRFDTVENFIGYTGLYPIVWESGKTKARFKMTHKGNKMLKMTFLVSSAAARRFNPTIREYYDRLRSRGKSKMAAGGAIARKLAAIVFTLLKRREKWNPEKAAAGMRKSQEMCMTIADNKKEGERGSFEVMPHKVANATNDNSSLYSPPLNGVKNFIT